MQASTRRHSFLVAAFLTTAASSVYSATGTDAASHASAPSSTPAVVPAATPATATTLAAPMTASQVIQLLDQTVDWYRTLGIQQQAANEPSDTLFLYDNRQTANKIIGLAFDVARADSDILSRQLNGAPDAGDASSQALVQFQAKLDTQRTEVQAELAARRARAPATRNGKPVNDAKVAELQGELDLISTKKTIADTMMSFSTGADSGVTGAGALKSQIDAMAIAIPSANAPATPATTTTTTGTPVASAASAPAAGLSVGAGSSMVGAPTRFGLWDLAANAFKLSEKAGTIAAIDRRTGTLQAALGKIREPLLEQMKALSARGDALAAQAETLDSSTLNGVREQLDSLANQFKETSALFIPLSKEDVLLTQYRRNLGNWRDTVTTQYHDALRTLGLRLAILLVILAALFTAAEVWRRAVLRYVHDSRRRYQLLLLRRIALWCVVVVVVGIAFASELGSIVTFAGLITAGIAVAMQSVLVSIVGYFFLIGKYGIRVGDRVQIGEVAGEVIDLGLVRMYLMELGAKGTMGPTGRVVAFANSVVFQVSGGLFKQIPGVNFSWRDVTLNLPVGANYTTVKEQLQAAVIEALKDYQPEILRQTREIERTTMSNSAGDADPQVRLQFSAGGVEAHVRYPVHLQHAAEIDERVTRALADVLTRATPAPAQPVR